MLAAINYLSLGARGIFISLTDGKSGRNFIYSYQPPIPMYDIFRREEIECFDRR